MLTESFITKLREALHFRVSQMNQIMPSLWETDQASYSNNAVESSQIQQIQAEVDALLPMTRKLVVQLERSQAIIAGIFCILYQSLCLTTN